MKLTMRVASVNTPTTAMKVALPTGEEVCADVQVVEVVLYNEEDLNGSFTLRFAGAADKQAALETFVPQEHVVLTIDKAEDQS